MSGFEDDFGEMVESKDEDLLQVLKYIDWSYELRIFKLKIISLRIWDTGLPVKDEYYIISKSINQ